MLEFLVMAAVFQHPVHWQVSFIIGLYVGVHRDIGEGPASLMAHRDIEEEP